MDIIRYMAKYDFDVARKICPLKGGVQYTECQDIFKKNAMMELLQECSNRLS